MAFEDMIAKSNDMAMGLLGALPCTIRQLGQEDIPTEILWDDVTVDELGMATDKPGGGLRSAVIDPLPRKDLTLVVAGKGEFRVVNLRCDGMGLTYVTVARL